MGALSLYMNMLGVFDMTDKLGFKIGLSLAFQ